MSATKQVGSRLYELSKREDIKRHVVLVGCATNSKTGEPLQGELKILVEPAGFRVTMGSAGKFYISCPRQMFDVTATTVSGPSSGKIKLWLSLRLTGMQELVQDIEVEPHDITNAVRVMFSMEPLPV